MCKEKWAETNMLTRRGEKKGVEKGEEEKCGREEKKGEKEGFYKDKGKMKSSEAYTCYSSKVQ